MQHPVLRNTGTNDAAFDKFCIKATQNDGSLVWSGPINAQGEICIDIQ